MFRVEMYYQVRRACLVEGMSIREASRVFSLHRKTVEKMLANATPQGYTRQRPPYRPKLEPLHRGDTDDSAVGYSGTPEAAPHGQEDI